jgi:ribosome-associated protein
MPTPKKKAGTTSKKPTVKKAVVAGSAATKKKAPRKAAGSADAASAKGASAGGGRKSDLARQHERALKFAIDAARLLADDKCRDVVVLDVRGASQVTDFTVVATGTSDRQMKSAGEHVDKMGEKTGMRLYRHNLKEANPTWVILDFVDVVIHIFEPESRLYYDIEMLWGDAPRVTWERASDLKARRDAEDAAEPMPTRNRAGLRRGEVL